MELDTYKSSGSRQSLSVFRQGLFVLRSLTAAADVGKSRTFESHYGSVRDDFLLLMSGAVRLFRQRGLCIPEHESTCTSVIVFSIALSHLVHCKLVVLVHT